MSLATIAVGVTAFILTLGPVKLADHIARKLLNK